MTIKFLSSESLSCRFSYPFQINFLNESKDEKFRGLRLGLYSSAGVFTCSGFLPGSLGRERWERIRENITFMSHYDERGGTKKKQKSLFLYNSLFQVFFPFANKLMIVQPERMSRCWQSGGSTTLSTTTASPAWYHFAPFNHISLHHENSPTHMHWVFDQLSYSMTKKLQHRTAAPTLRRRILILQHLRSTSQVFGRFQQLSLFPLIHYEHSGQTR